MLPGSEPKPTAERACSLSRAEDCDQQIRAAVDDARMILELRHGIDHAEQFHHPLDPGEIAERVMHDCKQVDAGQPRMAVGRLDTDPTADLA